MADATLRTRREGLPALAGALRNPLKVFGLIFLTGEGPLVVAYCMTPKNTNSALVLMGAIVLFIFGMGAFFCYIVACKPRHLFSPGEIPEAAIGKNLFSEPLGAEAQIGTELLRGARSIAADLSKTQSEDARRKLGQSLDEKLEDASHFQIAYDLLLVPGYDLSLIRDMLESYERSGTVDAKALSEARRITPSTVDTIESSMKARGLIKQHGTGCLLDRGGKKLLDSLHKHLLPVAS